MATTESGATAEIRQSQQSSLYSKPMLGLLAFSVPMLWKPVAHCISVLSHSLMHGPVLFAASALLTLLGFVLVWIGFRKDELTATLLGFMGGALIFMYGVEPSFALFANLLEIQPMTQDGYTLLTPNLLLMEASLVIYLVILIFVGANKDTRCRMFLWFHRNFGLRPNAPTPGYKRQFSRIAAMEAVFISWFFYLVIIMIVDPRILGLTHPATYVISAAILLWGIYLVAFKLVRYTSVASAIRYAIPVAGIIWYFVEIAALWRWYTEIWIKPFDYPVTNMVLAALFIAVVVAVNRSANRGARAAD